MTHAPRYFEDITVGEPLPTLEKEIRLTDMMAYGAATWDFARIHYDAAYARKQGLPSPIVDGQMLGAFLAQLVQDWAGPGGFLRSLDFQNRGMVFPGDVLTCGGHVTDIRREGSQATWWSAASGSTTRTAKGWSGRPPPPSASHPKTNPNDVQAHNQARPLPVGPQLRR